jgi:hypothetical protein
MKGPIPAAEAYGGRRMRHTWSAKTAFYEKSQTDEIKKMNKFIVMLKKHDVYVRIELRNKILTMKTTTSGVYTLNLFIYLMIL